MTTNEDTAAVPAAAVLEGLARLYEAVEADGHLVDAAVHVERLRDLARQLAGDANLDGYGSAQEWRNEIAFALDRKPLLDILERRS